MRRFLKRAFASVGILVLLVGLVLAVTGVPTPPGIEADGVSRVSWGNVLKIASLARGFGGAASFTAWDPVDGGIWVRTPASETGRISTPLSERVAGAGLLASARRIHLPPSGADFVVAEVDEGGSELYQLYRVDRNGENATLLTDQPTRRIVLGLNPAGTRIAYTSSIRNGVDYDLYLLDPFVPGSKELVLEAEGDNFARAWSPEGDKVLISRSLAFDRSRLFIFDIEARRLDPVQPEWGDSTLFTGSPRFSSDGTAIYFTNNHESEFARLYRYDLQSRAATLLTPSTNWDVSSPVPTPDGRHVLFLTNEEGLGALHLLDVESGEIDRVTGAPPGILGGRFRVLYPHPDEPTVALDVMGEDMGIYSYDLSSERWARWTPAPDAGSVGLPAELFRYPTFDSVDGARRTIPAFVYWPAEQGTAPLPVTIVFHGGPALQDLPGLDPRSGLIAGEGIAVIHPNVRGSTGYGRTFVGLDSGRRRPDVMRDVGALLDWIEAHPRLDVSRVAVRGDSYGGYMTLGSMVEYPDRIRCGAEGFGPSELVTHVEAASEGGFPTIIRDEYGDVRDPAMRAFLDSISPARRADQIKGRLLVIQGANDVRVKAEQSRIMVDRIREAGGTVAYIEARDEGHGFRNPLNIMYSFAATLDLLTGCLSP